MARARATSCWKWLSAVAGTGTPAGREKERESLGSQTRTARRLIRRDRLRPFVVVKPFVLLVPPDVAVAGEYHPPHIDQVLYLLHAVDVVDEPPDQGLGVLVCLLLGAGVAG